jgi:hypothetical protein
VQLGVLKLKAATALELEPDENEQGCELTPHAKPNEGADWPSTPRALARPRAPLQNSDAAIEELFSQSVSKLLLEELQLELVPSNVHIAATLVGVALFVISSGVDVDSGK